MARRLRETSPMTQEHREMWSVGATPSMRRCRTGPEKLRRLGPLVALVLAGACGRSSPLGAPPDGGAAPSTTSALCAVSTTESPPFGVTFRFRAGDVPAYVHTDGCTGQEWGVSSCASGFTEQLGPIFGACGLCECGASSCQVGSCGQCYPDKGVAIAPGTSFDAPWTGESDELGKRSDGQACESMKALPAAKYRVAIRAYDNASDAEARIGGWIATRDFDLPAPGGVVDVPLGGPGPESCEPPAGTALAACTGREARDVACDLGTTYRFERDGGELSLWFERFSLDPPALFTGTRTSNDAPGGSPETCAVQIPRCSADARVITTADLTRALAAPSVASAFGATMSFLGSMGGMSTYLVIQRGDGNSLGIGGECAATDTLCRPLTDELRAVSTILGQLESDLVNRHCPDWGPH
jgi:hypothetical protein